MTDKQKMFCKEYLIDLCATQAAIRAGYSPKTANEQSSRLLTNVSVRACIDAELAERSKRVGINADRVMRELARIAFVKPDDVVDLDNATVKDNAQDDDLAAIASVKVKTVSYDDTDSVEREIKFADKIKALELLGRHLGVFNDKIKVDSNLNLSGGVQIFIPDNGRKDGENYAKDESTTTDAETGADN